MTTFSARKTILQRAKRKRAGNAMKPLPHGQKLWPMFTPDSEPPKEGPLHWIGALLLAAAVLLIVAGCCGTVPLPSPYRPPAVLMDSTGEPQYLLPPEKQQKPKTQGSEQG